MNEALYKDILLAVAARTQNESTLASASEKLEQHLVQIEDSHKRIIQRENVVIEQFVAEVARSQPGEKDQIGAHGKDASSHGRYQDSQEFYGFCV
jgi:hypothetical protein